MPGRESGIFVCINDDARDLYGDPFPCGVRKRVRVHDGDHELRRQVLVQREQVGIRCSPELWVLLPHAERERVMIQQHVQVERELPLPVTALCIRGNGLRYSNTDALFPCRALHGETMKSERNKWPDPNYWSAIFCRACPKHNTFVPEARSRHFASGNNSTCALPLSDEHVRVALRMMCSKNQESSSLTQFLKFLFSLLFS